MSTVDAIYASGVFKPLEEVKLPENLRVRLTVDTSQPWAVDSWLHAVQTFHQQLIAQHGVFPDSTAAIAADRRCHE
jgi:predicted DNA-binding antitoxin AbrB/MazE fold protein